MDGVRGEVAIGFSVEDNVSSTTEGMIAGQEKLASKAKTTTDQFESQRIKNIECLAALNSFRGGLRQAASSMHELGIVDDQTYETMSKLIAGVTLFTATAETLKGAVLIYNMLTAASSRFAISSIFAAAAQNPALAVAAIAGASVATYGIASMMSQSSSSSSSTTNNNITTFNFNNAASDRTSRTQSSALTTGSYYGG